MWFRRRRQRAQIDLSALDRLAELVDRIVTLLPQQPVAQELPALPPPEPPVPTEPVEPATQPVALLFVASSFGYSLLESNGVAPERGTTVELAGGSFRVLRLGPSPLPGDRRRCAFLEREEPPAEARTPDG